MATVLLRFSDLKKRAIVGNRVTLKRWIDEEGFPPGIMLGAHTRAWRESDVEEWLASRPATHPDAPIGRPPKAPVAAAA